MNYKETSKGEGELKIDDEIGDNVLKQYLQSFPQYKLS